MRLFDVIPNFPFTTSETMWRRRAIITYKHGIYELPHELPHESPNYLRLRITRN